MRIRDATRRDATRCDTTRREARLLARPKFRFTVSSMVRERNNLDRTRDFFSFLSFVTPNRIDFLIESHPSSLGIDLDGSIKGLFKIIVTMTLWIIGYRRCIEPCKIRLWKSSSDFDANLIGILVQTRKPNLRSVNSKGFEFNWFERVELAMLDTRWSAKDNCRLLSIIIPFNFSWLVR